MEKRLSLIILAVSLVLITACSNLSGSSGSSSGYYKYTGSSALDVNFVKDAPVSSEKEYYEPGELIDVEVELANKGTKRILPNTVRLRLTGDAIIPNFFTGAKEILFPLSLDPIDEETGYIDNRIVDLGPLRYIGEVTSRRSKVITGQYCYYVPAVVQTSVVLSDKQEDIPGQNIQAGDNPPSGVQVTSLEQEVVKVREGDRAGTMRFKFVIENVGSGSMIDSLQDCWDYEKRRREKVSFVIKGPYPIVCEEGTVILRDKKRTVDCTMTNIDPTNLGSVNRDLIIILDNFAYLEEIPAVTIYLDKRYS